MKNRNDITEYESDRLMILMLHYERNNQIMEKYGENSLEYPFIYHLNGEILSEMMEIACGSSK